MSEHVALSSSCNLDCDYCYETESQLRMDNPVKHDYDLDKVFARLEKWKKKRPNTTPGLHGGEPMLLPQEDLEKIIRWIYNNYDGDGGHIQTNGTKIRERHVKLFKKYNVGVGISCDGPPELNKARKLRGGNEEQTDSMSYNTQRAIALCSKYNLTPGIITVLHANNAGTEERFEKLLNWIDNLNRMGISGHFNPAIPYEDVPEGEALTPEKLKHRYLRAWEWMKAEPHRSWDPFHQYVDNLLGLGLGNCVNNRCDVFNAGAAKIVLGDGETTGCGKTWSAVGDGVPFLQGDSSGQEYNDDDAEERYEMLKQVPGAHTEGEPDMGGCKGCKFWGVCQGGCPPSGLDDDFRNRTRWCEAKYALYDKIEQDMKAIFPQIRTITDLPWDTETWELNKNRQLDIKPFGNMRHDNGSNDPSTHQKRNHKFGEPEDLVPENNLPEEDAWEKKKRRAKKKYGKNAVEIDEKTKTIHADSS